MASTNQTTKNPTPPPQISTREQQQQSFRQFLRQADKFILEHQFEKARIELAEARKIDSTNPFLIAFEERMAIFEGKKKGPHKSSPVSAEKVSGWEEVHSLPAEPADNQKLVDREMLEKKLRQEIELEYKARFTKEIRKAEEIASKVLSEEKAKIEQHRHNLEAKYQLQIDQARAKIEQESQQTLSRELTQAEQRLRQQHQSELANNEKTVNDQLAKKYENELRQLEERLKKEQNALLEGERQAFKEREKLLEEQFNKKLLEGMRSNEVVVREQSQQQQQLEQEQIKQKIAAEFQTALAVERESMKHQYEAMKASLETSFKSEQQRLKVEADQHVQDQLEVLRKREEKDFEKKRIALHKEMEKEFQAKYEDQLAGERDRIQRESDEAIEAEKRRLQEEFNQVLDAQTENIQNIRSELRREMEKAFLARLERVAQEYDYKMELLGAKIPSSPQDRVAFYREKMKSCYESGQPSVADAKLLMRLKELLELTFDEHLSIEADVRLDLYAKTVEKRIFSGELSMNMPNALEALKQQFRISAEEANKLEPYILSSFQRLATKGKILLVDDDLLILQSVGGMLNDNGYQTITAPDIKTGLEQLNTTSVDLILSDIKFAVGELDGFKFFRAVQEQPHLRAIPFVFMSSLQDGVIMQSGMQLGVDDYLTKPMDPDFLLAVIEGKLKRFRHQVKA